MRAIIDLPSEIAEPLQAHCVRAGISRAEAVRRALTLYNAQVAQAAQPTTDLDAAFGLFKHQNLALPEGLAYQESLRSDWD